MVLRKKLEDTAEYRRMNEKKKQGLQLWDDWGCFVSERAWGTVREDYSSDGDAWNYLPHEQARSMAYRWSEDGIAGLCDRAQLLNFAPAFWNGNDEILKERLFGLSSWQGNHGEDVKEYYFYADATPTQSYMKYIYKYPHAAFPYQQLIDENQKRTAQDREFELCDTGVFDQDRYFDITIEYAKEDPDDICMRITVENRGAEQASFHLLGQLWFRNRWAWGKETPEVPSIQKSNEGNEHITLYADSAALPPGSLLTYEYHLPTIYLYGSKECQMLFTHNDSNNEKFNKGKNRTPYVKDAFHRVIVDQEKSAVGDLGTKAALYQEVQIPAKGKKIFVFRMTSKDLKKPLKEIEQIVDKRKSEADEFYAAIHPENSSADDHKIQRQALAGMIWSQQFYHFDVEQWINTPPPGKEKIRNSHWQHLRSAFTISMPDKWEYPWFASWDLAFHCLPLALVNLELAKNQLSVLLRQQFQHSNGQLPAYEWEFSDLNPPVQAWTLWKLYEREKKVSGKVDREFLGRAFHKILINFGWWVNKVDKMGNNLFEGGFLGLDNISVIDRSEALPEGEELEQSDGTGWIGFASLLMMRLSLVLAHEDSSYLGLANKFFDNFLAVTHALEMCSQKSEQMWNEEDGFFYDVLCYPDGTHKQLKVRSLVGIIPLYAIEMIPQEEIDRVPLFKKYLEWHEKYRPEKLKGAVYKLDEERGYLFSMTRLHQIKKVLRYVWDENEFRSRYGLRSISKYHEKNPFEMDSQRVCYEPGESPEKIKGGNSNWRGPIWFPTSFLLIDALKNLDLALGEELNFEDAQGKKVTAGEMAQTFAHSLIDLFRETPEGKRPIYGEYDVFTKPDWRNNILFYEHYHGDNGRGLGASHQTGWSGLVATLIDDWC